MDPHNPPFVLSCEEGFLLLAIYLPLLAHPFVLPAGYKNGLKGFGHGLDSLKAELEGLWVSTTSISRPISEPKPECRVTWK